MSTSRTSKSINKYTRTTRAQSTAHKKQELQAIPEECAAVAAELYRYTHEIGFIMLSAIGRPRSDYGRKYDSLAFRYTRPNTPFIVTEVNVVIEPLHKPNENYDYDVGDIIVGSLRTNMNHPDSLSVAKDWIKGDNG